MGIAKLKVIFATVNNTLKNAKSYLWEERLQNSQDRVGLAHLLALNGLCIKGDDTVSVTGKKASTMSFTSPQIQRLTTWLNSTVIKLGSRVHCVAPGSMAVIVRVATVVLFKTHRGEDGREDPNGKPKHHPFSTLPNYCPITPFGPSQSVAF